MKSKFLMTLPALISLPIISATCTNVNQNNSASETKKPNANNKSQNDKIIVHNGSTNEDDNKINNDQSKPGQNNGTNTNLLCQMKMLHHRQIQTRMILIHKTMSKTNKCLLN